MLSGLHLLQFTCRNTELSQKSIQTYPSALQLLDFGANFSLSMQETETTTEFACAALEEKARGV